MKTIKQLGWILALGSLISFGDVNRLHALENSPPAVPQTAESGKKMGNYSRSISRSDEKGREVEYSVEWYKDGELDRTDVNRWGYDGDRNIWQIQEGYNRNRERTGYSKTENEFDEKGRKTKSVTTGTSGGSTVIAYEYVGDRLMRERREDKTQDGKGKRGVTEYEYDEEGNNVGLVTRLDLDDNGTTDMTTVSTAKYRDGVKVEAASEMYKGTSKNPQNRSISEWEYDKGRTTRNTKKLLAYDGAIEAIFTLEWEYDEQGNLLVCRSKDDYDGDGEPEKTDITKCWSPEKGMRICESGFPD